jgi:hypothetical protein
LALVEKLHREDLSHQERSTRSTSSLVQVSGLHRTAGELGMSQAWLSRRLSMRQDPVIFPALETGKIGFSQANEAASSRTSWLNSEALAGRARRPTSMLSRN